MSDFDSTVRSSLSGMLGRSVLNHEEIADLRCKAWREQGLLIVHASDRRLSQQEAETIRSVAERLYGGTTS